MLLLQAVRQQVIPGCGWRGEKGRLSEQVRKCALRPCALDVPTPQKTRLRDANSGIKRHRMSPSLKRGHPLGFSRGTLERWMIGLIASGQAMRVFKQSCTLTRRAPAVG